MGDPQKIIFTKLYLALPDKVDYFLRIIFKKPSPAPY